MISYKPKSLNSILSSFTKVLDDLQVLQEHNGKQVESCESQIATLEARARTLRDENEKASRVADRIKLIVE